MDLKGKVKVRMIRNKTRYKRLTSIYIEYRGHKINTQNKNEHN